MRLEGCSDPESHLFYSNSPKAKQTSSTSKIVTTLASDENLAVDFCEPPNLFALSPTDMSTTPISDLSTVTKEELLYDPMSTDRFIKISDRKYQNVNVGQKLNIAGPQFEVVSKICKLLYYPNLVCIIVI